MTLAWFEHDRGKGCLRKEFPYVRTLCKDYRLEAEWEENAAKCFGTLNSLVFTEHSGVKIQCSDLFGSVNIYITAMKCQ